MRRREFIVLAGGVSAGLSRRGWAQQPRKLPTIGFLGVDPAMWSAWTAGFVDRLGELGWVDNRTVTIEYRWAKGRPELHAQFAAEFARLNVDVIVTSGAAVPALMKATSSIPIVFAVANDPVGGGLVKSLSHPGGNVTGISLQTLELANKRFGLLHEAVPSLRRLAIMADANFAQSRLELAVVSDLARQAQIEVVPLEIRRSEDITTGLGSAVGLDVLYVVINELLNANRLLIVESAKLAKLPSIFGTRDWALSGGMMSYGAYFPALFARSAEMVDKILKGASAGDIPVEQASRLELVINMRTVDAIGASIPRILLTYANEILE